jgi:N-formylglutamate deformylase
MLSRRILIVILSGKGLDSKSGMSSSGDHTGNFGGDAVLADLAARPFVIAAPARQAAPFIFASPHSGRIYPPSFLRASRLDALNLRKSEDAFVEELFASAVALGAPMLAARFPRAYVDPNRAAEELDAAMFDGRIARAAAAPSTHVSAGLGVIPRLVREGLDIYRARVPADEAEFRIAHFHRPYHAALAQLVNETRARFGVAAVIDCHSMPSGVKGADIVVGDRHETSAARELSAHAVAILRGLGFDVVRNAPYAGGYTTALHGRPAEGIHALQIEINRALYLHEDTMDRAQSFSDCRELLGHFVSALLKADLRWLMPRGLLPRAAE